MTQSLVRMHLPTLGAQFVNASELKLWESKGGYVLPDETADERDANAARDKENANALAQTEAAQAHATALHQSEGEAGNKATREPLITAKPVLKSVVASAVEPIAAK